MVQGGAGWHGARALVVSPCITLVPLPPYSPQLNPMERVWLYLRARHLSLRLLPATEAIVDASCDAWNALVGEAGRPRTLCLLPFHGQDHTIKHWDQTSEACRLMKAASAVCGAKVERAARPMVGWLAKRRISWAGME